MDHYMVHYSNNRIHSRKIKPKGGESPPTFIMTIKVSIQEAYELAKDWHIAKGWPKYALIKLFEKEWERYEGRPLDLHNSLIDFTHFKSLKEVQEEYQDDWYIKISEGYAFGVHNSVSPIEDAENNNDGFHLEYLIRD